MRALGGAIRHVKPHGALYNVAAQNEEVARAIGAAVARWNPRATLFGLAGSRSLEVWRGMGLAALPPKLSPTAATSPMARCARAASRMR